MSRTRVFVGFAAGILLLPQLNTLFAASAADYAEATALIRQSKLEQASGKLEKILATAPQDARAETLLGTVRTKQNRLDEAEQLFVKAIEHSPKSPEAYEKLGALYSEFGNQDGAVTVYEKLLAEVPASAAARTAMAGIYTRRKQYEKSLSYAEKVATAKRPSRLLPVLLTDYLELSRGQDAQKTISEILPRLKSDPKLVLDVTEVFLKKNMVGDAAQFLKIASRLQKPTAAYFTALARVQGRQKQDELAQQSIAQALKLKPDLPDAVAEAARLAGARGDWKSAADLMKKAVKLEPRNADYLQTTVFVLMKLGLTEDAHPFATRLRALRPNDLEASLGLATVYVRGKWWGSAKPILAELMQQYPNEPRVMLLMGIARYQLGELTDARKDFDAVLTRDAGNPEAHYYRGLLAKQDGDVDGAVSELEKAIAREPDHIGALETVGPLYVQVGQLAKAREALERAAKLAPGKSGTHYQLAMIYSRLGETEKAKEQQAIYQRLSKH